jgi:hypothetical protein
MLRGFEAQIKLGIEAGTPIKLYATLADAD